MKPILFFVLSSVWLIAPFVLGNEKDLSFLLDKAEQVNETLWKRFIAADGIMYDYTDLDGTVILPTPEECEKSMPNALAWWTPVENGGFFNGMYLISQCMRCERNDTPENREKVKRLVRGLYKLQDVGETPGFIARGVGSDGRCHYAASSDDQNFPFILGLWRYLKTDLPSKAEREECLERLVRHVETLKKNDWRIVGDRPDFIRGNWLSTDYHSAVHMLMTVWIMADLTGKDEWKTFYRDLLDENKPDGAARRGSIRSGPPDLAHWSAWFYAGCQYSIREMRRSEADADLKRLYGESLRESGKSAAKLIELYKKFDRGTPKFFTPDWHRMMPPYRDQKNGDEANKLAMEQYPVWCKACPAIQHEKATLKPAVCGAWIVALSEDPELLAAARPGIVEAVRYFDYSRLHYSAFFFVENLVYTLNDGDRSAN